MVLEYDIPKFVSWIGPAIVWYLAMAGVAAVAAALLTWFAQAVASGPLTGGDRVYRGVLAGLGDILATSPRRVWAMARLAIQESLRRNVLVVLGIFALILLFAGWFLDPASVNPARLYIGFILGATNLLVCLVTLVLAVFSLPADIKSKAIQTVTTKPVRTSEIVLGRIVGFAAVGTCLLALMAVAGWAFVVRSVSHSHTLEQADVFAEVGGEGEASGFEGHTSYDRGHRHRVPLDGDGNGQTDTTHGHRHRVVVTGTTASGERTYRVDEPIGMLEARRPLRGSLRFLDREGRPSAKGISVGAEWSYRQFIEGGTAAAAIWTFEGVTPDEFAQGLPLEMTVRVFRTHKGQIEEGIHGTIQLQNPATKVRSEPLPIVAKEFTIESLLIPRKIGTVMSDGTLQEVDLFNDLVSDGRVEVWLQCLEPAQYYGVAQADFFLRAGEGSFVLNYVKSCLGIWFSMLICTALGVMFSTFLSGPVALIGTLSTLIVGQFREFIGRLFTSQVSGDATLMPGGGPIESLYRIVTQTSITLELDPTPAVQAMKVIDTILLAPVQLAAVVFPSLSSLGTSDFVAGGFDIPGDLLAAHAAETFGYVLAFFVAGVFCLKAREVAS